ncbi:molecular chaperone GroES [Acholeplasma laidlawii]|nr:molecular chaperone GroES [Acholeplasma laidlawii]OED28882.1 molecular chaperone GroES [Acholeplasma laidlawii]OWU87207.1 molecular chaperone GroES [Acholeplasma laidlawii]
MVIKPLEDYVVLSVKKEEKTTASGIILATEDKDKPAMGKVISIGPKVENIKVNDEVIYQSYAGTKVKLKEVEYLLVQSKNILAIIEE